MAVLQIHNVEVARRYRILHYIGCGRFAEVWTAIDRQACSQNMRVAVKVLKPQHCGNPDICTLFHREADVLKRTANIPGIIHFYDKAHMTITPKMCHGQTKKKCVVPCLIMEYVEGIDLLEVLRTLGNGFDRTTALTIALKACLIFLEAHQAEVAHNDIKLKHVLRLGDGNIKIIDWNSGVIPENDKEKKIRQAIDIMEFGQLLFSLFTGKMLTRHHSAREQQESDYSAISEAQIVGDKILVVNCRDEFEELDDENTNTMEDHLAVVTGLEAGDYVTSEISDFQSEIQVVDSDPELTAVNAGKNLNDDASDDLIIAEAENIIEKESNDIVDYESEILEDYLKSCLVKHGGSTSEQVDEIAFAGSEYKATPELRALRRLFHAKMSHWPVDFSPFAAVIDAEMEAIIKRCLAPGYYSRYHSMQELFDDLILYADRHHLEPIAILRRSYIGYSYLNTLKSTKKDYAKTLTWLNHKLRKSPDNLKLLYKLGTLYFKIGEYESAISYLRRPATSANPPRRAQLHFLAALVFAQRLEEAAQILPQIPKSHLASPTGQFCLGNIYLYQKKYLLGYQSFLKVLEIDNSQPSTQYYAGLSLLHLAREHFLAYTNSKGCNQEMVAKLAKVITKLIASLEFAGQDKN